MYAKQFITSNKRHISYIHTRKRVSCILSIHSIHAPAILLTQHHMSCWSCLYLWAECLVTIFPALPPTGTSRKLAQEWAEATRICSSKLWQSLGWFYPNPSTKNGILEVINKLYRAANKALYSCWHGLLSNYAKIYRHDTTNPCIMRCKSKCKNNHALVRSKNMSNLRSRVLPE